VFTRQRSEALKYTLLPLSTPDLGIKTKWAGTDEIKTEKLNPTKTPSDSIKSVALFGKVEALFGY
jgi:hypothetical protein